MPKSPPAKPDLRLVPGDAEIYTRSIVGSVRCV